MGVGNQVHVTRLKVTWSGADTSSQHLNQVFYINVMAYPEKLQGHVTGILDPN